VRVLHVITRLILGGAQQNTVLTCRALAEAGHEAHLAYGPIYGPEGSLLGEAEASGAVLHELPWMRRAVSPWHDAGAYRGLRRLIRELKPDVVHTHSSKAGIVGRAAAWAQGVPVVVHTVHGLPFHDRQPRWVHRAYVAAERWAAKRCHHLIAITPAMVEAFAAAGIAEPDRFEIVPSGVDLQRFEGADSPEARAAARRRLGLPGDVPVLGVLARLDPLKGHADVLDVLPGLRERYPGLRVVFIGDGWHGPALRARVEREGLQDVVQFTGLVPHEDIAGLLPGVDVKLLPSYQEGQSRTLAEALLCGCGIVAYDAGGIGSLCEDRVTGRLVAVGDREALAEATGWMLDDARRRRSLTAAGAQRVRDGFSAAAMNARLLELYARWVGEAQQRR
jgi:glycosyltransferase involved in cell wall biosynthesis